MEIFSIIMTAYIDRQLKITFSFTLQIVYEPDFQWNVEPYRRGIVEVIVILVCSPSGSNMVAACKAPKRSFDGTSVQKIMFNIFL